MVDGYMPPRYVWHAGGQSLDYVITETARAFVGIISFATALARDRKPLPLDVDWFPFGTTE